MAKWWIGCSGFHYKHWKDIFYPEKLAQSKWFDYYNNRFKTLELNVTFYRFPRLPYLENWYHKSPDAFTFSIKAPRAITHYRKFVKAEKYLEDFYGTVREGLKEKVGCVLFQMPEVISYKQQKLEQIIQNLDPTFTNVLEFRNATWWNQEVYNTLANHNITFCGMSHPSLPDEVVQNTSTLYHRFHGVPHLYKSKYALSTLKKISDEIENNSAIKEAFIYFNNDIDGSALTNAFQMESYIERLQKKRSKLK
ncbi:DUF72 domain-containing protein [Segetibacter aerophilus]|uniref:Histidine kinase n=1 Tax=Segetibacter aerophilus TaxID=670293 RepID=A0A512B6I0_9BACT|nr:DUF72 domain-containing protein [Segetibacter aerophilus]GEO07572.1 hypothetical protein SAE01_00680 [Segetibacter aerophilus]